MLAEAAFVCVRLGRKTDSSTGAPWHMMAQVHCGVQGVCGHDCRWETVLRRIAEVGCRETARKDTIG